MKFWHDCLEAVYDNQPPAQPIVFQLQKAVVQHKLTKRWLQRLITSREENLNIKSFTSLSSVEDYAENSVSSVLYLTLECLGVRSVHADHAASHLGRAQGIVTLIRAVPFNAKRNRVMIPIELLIKHKVSQNDLLRGVSDSRVKDLTFDLASTANVHIEKVYFISHSLIHVNMYKISFLTVLGQKSHVSSAKRSQNRSSSNSQCSFLSG